MKATIIAALLPAALAATASPSYNFYSISSHSGNINYHLQAFEARNENIYISGKTNTYCPSNVGAGCPKPGNETAFVASTTSGGAAMDVEVPGGQLLFVRCDGAVGYTIPHSGVTPAGSYTTGFKLSAKPPMSGPVAEFTFSDGGANAFYACGTEKQIYANVKGFKQDASCVSIGWLAAGAGSQPAAWEYL